MGIEAPETAARLPAGEQSAQVPDLAADAGGGRWEESPRGRRVRGAAASPFLCTAEVHGIGKLLPRFLEDGDQEFVGCQNLSPRLEEPGGGVQLGWQLNPPVHAGRGMWGVQAPRWRQRERRGLGLDSASTPAAPLPRGAQRGLSIPGFSGGEVAEGGGETQGRCR